MKVFQSIPVALSEHPLLSLLWLLVLRRTEWWEGSVSGLLLEGWGLRDGRKARGPGWGLVVLLTNPSSGPGGQESPLPGPLPSMRATAGRGTSAIQIVISCCRLLVAVFFRTVAETREAELGGGQTGEGI